MTEQELILIDLLKCRRVDLYARDVDLTQNQEEQLSKIQDRRKSGEPLQYILGRTTFLNTELLVDARVLIPRPETELLVEALIKKSRSFKRDLRILDIGTGSGNIAIALAKNIPNAFLTAVDISLDALDLAKVNAQLNGVSDKINFTQSDLFSGLEQEAISEKFDIIVSNPPYIKKEDIGRLPADVRREPVIALDGGEDGLEFYRRIIAHAQGFLNPGGFLALEMGDGQKFFLEKIFAQHKNFQVTEFIKDYVNTDRIIIAELKIYG
ncbi:MAG: peptide chain release factor N(5)-glutamine methyltransferase [Candidatus Omnitrophota bacterium]